MSNVLDDNGAGAQERPTFLTVLCIISWVLIPIGMIFNVLAYTALAALGSVATELGGAEVMAASPINPIGFLINAAMGAVSIFAVVMMWQLKKTGFFIYVGTVVATLVVSFIMLGGTANLNVMSIVSAALFPILYGLNLKALVK